LTDGFDTVGWVVGMTKIVEEHFVSVVVGLATELG